MYVHVREHVRVEAMPVHTIHPRSCALSVYAEQDLHTNSMLRVWSRCTIMYMYMVINEETDSKFHTILLHMCVDRARTIYVFFIIRMHINTNCREDIFKLAS